MSWVGRPTAVRIKSIVTSPALGILAAPILARVAVRLGKDTAKHLSNQRLLAIIMFRKTTKPQHVLRATPYTYPMSAQRQLFTRQ